ncbi:hypothetical protein LEN26_008253 [Aphanomyces euteiches]|uniref:F-box domain-containing protein n=1 Tax=Aphanomyces euteiches TaxID=100861 RepID=A0A6G0XMA4_9STRA|nr:hypothetical protein Ae201684_003442 [Aphanomyces euteiches]KAH9098322.1 hypothetical protein Ae201684P_017537 [Aphanomyces euteiches]KAH9107996.1 hypothetical protein AeMF1_016733 [Aphanomyces euteiches]KAH9130716.1 hypothetical protein LEN26_008253 [Aphanomyces euteiches]KAH9197928.1 hypothetical protein AeNC1_000109 [Aphanomyces euteiches]
MSKRQVRRETPTRLDALAQALFAGFVDSFVVVRSLSLINRQLLKRAATYVRALDLHATVHPQRLLTHCVLPRYGASLLSLSLQWTASTSDTTVAVIVSSLPRLTHLNLHGCKQLTNRAVAIIASLTALTSLDLSFCVLIEDVRPLMALRFLGRLKLGMCSRLNGHSLATLPASLIELDVGCCPVLCENQLLSRFHLLQVLDISGAVVDAPHVAAFTRVTAPHLTYLSLAHCHSVSLMKLWQLWEPMPVLRVLILRGIFGHDENGFHPNWTKRVKECCPGLRFLDISCSDRNDEAKRMLHVLMPSLVVEDGHAEFPIRPIACADAEGEPVDRVLIVRPHALA